MKKEVCKPQPISLDELERAEITLLKLIQRDAFYEDIARISNRSRLKPENRDSDTSRKTGVKRSSQLSWLDPFLDQNGLLRVGGRLQKLEELDEGIRQLSSQDEGILLT
jgi:hypothetical protein